MGAYDCDCINNLEYDRRERKAQLFSEGATSDQHVATDTNVGNNSEIPNSWDCISRQQAIDIVVFECGKWTGLAKEISKQLKRLPPAQPGQWIPVSERLPSKEECKEWIDNNLDGIGYLYPCLVTRYSSINPDRTKNNPYVAKHYFDGEDFLNAGEEVRSEYIIAWMPLPEPYNPNK